MGERKASATRGGRSSAFPLRYYGCSLADRARHLKNSLALWASGVAHVALRRYENGIALLERAATQKRRGGFVLGALGWALATGGRTEKGRAILAELRERPEPAPTVVSEVWLLAALGDHDGAFELLARAEGERQPYLPFTGLPGFDRLRADPRFGALLDRLGLSSGSRAPS